ncbi:hypothetical protein H2200_007448 [Cladophialophora chaetospira]|uniref:Uncharacterized protein n=1 Tax=Cladophialophora chaetospira TaxID=386627 RepID=A0AA38X7T5_9EURO|nr:hypothetical protein H2200_007448 [Cladophialophora chaetospira]
MERPSKRMKITDPDVRDPRGSGSRRTEGLFTSELGMRSDDTDSEALPTRTISLSDFQRHNVFGSYQHAFQPGLNRRDAGIYLLPRAPDATVTANVVEVNVNDGKSTSKVTEVAAGSTGTVVSLTDIGALTTAVSVIIPGTDNSTITTGSATDSSPGTITSSSTTPSPPDTSTITSFTSSSSSIPTINSNGTISTNGTEERTVTVTATSTFELSLINGTIIATEPPHTHSSTRSGSGRSTGTASSSASRTFTFGEMSTTPTNSLDTLTTSYVSATASDNLSGVGSTNGASSTSDAVATSSSSSSSGGGGGGGTSLTPTQQQVVGGVVGGVAGIAIVLVIVLFVLRWYRRRLKERGQLPEQIAARELAAGGGGGAYPMSQRSSTVPLTAVVAQGLRRLRPHSSQTLRTTGTATTDASVPESERGFQRIAGRKIAPVIGGGGDPYGGNYGAFDKDAGVGPSDLPERGLSGASFYQDNRGFYGGKGLQTPPIPSSPTTATTSAAKTGDISATGGPSSSTRDFAGPRAANSSQISLTTPTRPEGYAVMRPSPARTPVTLSPSASSIRLPIQQPPTLGDDAPPVPRIDGVGRSLASQDGSRVSRSSGRSAGRFVENM